MPAWAYFCRPTNLAFHDLTLHTPPPRNLRSLLGLSLKFIPNPRFNVPWGDYESKTFERLTRNFKVKAFMAANLDVVDEEFNPRLYQPTDWTPPESVFPFPETISTRLSQFYKAVKQMHRRQKAKRNLLPLQARSLRVLRNQNDFIIAQCDKNLGPAVIERDRYIELAFRDHLGDHTTYKRLTPQRAGQLHRTLRNKLADWIERWKKQKKLTKNEFNFLSHHLHNNEEPFATFYLTMKVHKSPLKTRPIVSCSGSLLHALGLWVDDKLQQAAKVQKSYFKSSFDLKKILDTLDIPGSALLFTADAESMYTNIPTGFALQQIGQYLHRRERFFRGIPVTALMQALDIVMRNNIFTFGDTTWLQRTGTAMGTPPAPPWATLYYALCENGFLPRFEDNLFFYRRFIDDVFGVWVPPAGVGPDPIWPCFVSAMNDPRFRLTWVVSALSHQVDFMDLTISIRGHRLHTTLYEKPSNHHLYIPPHSCHPPGLLSGIVHGMLFRIHTLCSDPADRQNRTIAFFRQLQRRGYLPRRLFPMFNTALRRLRLRAAGVANAPVPATDTSLPSGEKDLQRCILFHLQYHPKNPKSQDLQHAWRNLVARPPGGIPLPDVRNSQGVRIGVERLIVAHNRPPNLGNLLSYRKLRDNPGPPVSSFCD